MSKATVYTINRPFGSGQILVVGVPDSAWYEYLILSDDGSVIHESDDGYGSPEVALRDALILDTSPDG